MLYNIQYTFHENNALYYIHKKETKKHVFIPQDSVYFEYCVVATYINKFMYS